MHDHPDDKTRLHSEHLGWYIADVLYEKYGMNRTGNAIVSKISKDIPKGDANSL